MLQGLRWASEWVLHRPEELDICTWNKLALSRFDKLRYRMSSMWPEAQNLKNKPEGHRCRGALLWPPAPSSSRQSEACRAKLRFLNGEGGLRSGSKSVKQKNQTTATTATKGEAAAKGCKKAFCSPEPKCTFGIPGRQPRHELPCQHDASVSCRRGWGAVFENCHFPRWEPEASARIPRGLAFPGGSQLPRATVPTAQAVPKGRQDGIMCKVPAAACRERPGKST